MCAQILVQTLSRAELSVDVCEFSPGVPQEQPAGDGVVQRAQMQKQQQDAAAKDEPVAPGHRLPGSMRGPHRRLSARLPGLRRGADARHRAPRRPSPGVQRHLMRRHLGFLALLIVNVCATTRAWCHCKELLRLMLTGQRPFGARDDSRHVVSERCYRLPRPPFRTRRGVFDVPSDSIAIGEASGQRLSPIHF
jgi:hypothetical protein